MDPLRPILQPRFHHSVPALCVIFHPAPLSQNDEMLLQARLKFLILFYFQKFLSTYHHESSFYNPKYPLVPTSSNTEPFSNYLRTFLSDENQISTINDDAFWYYFNHSFNSASTVSGKVSSKLQQHFTRFYYIFFCVRRRHTESMTSSTEFLLRL